MTTVNQPKIEIDPNSGFCFGVTASITKAESELKASSGSVYCLGDLVHNSAEMDRLHSCGLITVSHTDFPHLSGHRVMLRAHGEPPSTYATANAHGIEIIDATCPVVLKLQQRIAATYAECNRDVQIVIYGHTGHAEVNGLVGQTDGTAIVIDDGDPLTRIDPSRPVALYSQTTQSIEGFQAMVRRIGELLNDGVAFTHYDTICRQVSGRVEKLRRFAADHDVVLFVSGQKSSNGKVLFAHCHEVNPRTYMLAQPSQLREEWIADTGIKSIGICGATSTPRWLMEEVMKQCTDMLQPIDRQ